MFQRNCKHFGVCGGCSFPQIAYHNSLQEKEATLRERFAPITEACEIFPVIPSPSPFRGRNKMEFSFYQTYEGERSLGFITPQKPKRGLPITECLMIDPRVMEILNITRAWWDSHPNILAYYPPLNKGSLCTLTVRVGNTHHDFMIVLTVSGASNYSLDKALIYQWAECLQRSQLPITSIFLEERIAQKSTPTQFVQHLIYGQPFIQQTLSLPEDHNSSIFHVGPKSFFQPQITQAVKIIETAKKFINPKGDEILLDLYCGAGTLGIMLAPYVKKVIGVEIVQEAVEKAHQNIQINNKTNVEIYASDVKTFCQQHMKNITPDIVIVDPPRCGMQNKVLKYLLKMSPKRIIYVSCNPVTQFEECSQLIQQGYSLKKMQPIDQFPHTQHIENVVLLEKSDNSHQEAHP